MKNAYPNVPYIGLGDGAADNWSYLKPLTDHQTLDFYHASEYVGKAAMVVFKGAKKKSGKRSVAGKPASSIEAQAGSGESFAFGPG